MNDVLKKQLAAVTTDAGVYLYKNAEGKIIYVGKAKNLRNRTRSYFQSSKNHSPKTLVLVSQIESMETIVAGGELEALVLESNLIKRHRPRYNIILKDDKSYPYLKLTVDEEYPRLLVSRRPHGDGAKYYGPYVHVGAMRETMRLIFKNLGIRQCNIEIDRRRPRACIYFDMHQCEAPCVSWGETKEQYGLHVERVRHLLEGRDDQLSKDINQSMLKASQEERFEDAARFRDSLNAIQKVQMRQRVVLDKPRDLDVVTLSGSEAGEPAAQVYFVRAGKLIDRQTCRLSSLEEIGEGEAIRAFLLQYYGSGAWVPEEILLAEPLEDMQSMRDWLAKKKGQPVKLTAPRRGQKHHLVKLVEENSKVLVIPDDSVLGHTGPRGPGRDREGALLELQELFQLPRAPRRVEGFDISHVQGTHTVASLVVMENGHPLKKDYRNYHIKTVKGIDDFASMKEVVGRRYRRLLNEKKALPDLILIDGGKGQLAAAVESLKALNLDHLPIFGLAKRLEEFFVPGRSRSLRLGDRSAGRLMMQRLRDEAHRFAVTFHRKLRSRALLRSELDDVEGVGPAMKKTLLEIFGGLGGVRKASEADLLEVKGVGKALAARIRARMQAGDT